MHEYACDKFLEYINKLKYENKEIYIFYFIKHKNIEKHQNASKWTKSALKSIEMH